MTTDIEICTSALLMVGAEEINSFLDASREAKVCAATYPITKQNLLQTHPWRFTLKQVQLALITSPTPLFDFQNAFQLPSDMLRLIKAETAVRYEVYGDQLFTDASEIFITYQADPGEAEYPSYFVRLLELEMAVILAISLEENQSKAQLFRAEADTHSRKAKNTDSQQQPARGMRSSNFLIAAARHPDTGRFRSV